MAGGLPISVKVQDFEPKSYQEFLNLVEKNPIRAQFYILEVKNILDKAESGDRSARVWLANRERFGIPYREVADILLEDREVDPREERYLKERKEWEDYQKELPFEERETTAPRVVPFEDRETTAPKDLEGTGKLLLGNIKSVEELKNYLDKPIPKYILKKLNEYFKIYEYLNVLDSNIIINQINNNEFPESSFNWWLNTFLINENNIMNKNILYYIPLITLGYKDFLTVGSFSDPDLDDFSDVDFQTYMGKSTPLEFVNRLIKSLKMLEGSRELIFKELKSGFNPKTQEQRRYTTLDDIILNKKEIIRELKKGQLIKTEFIFYDIRPEKELDNFEVSNNFFFGSINDRNPEEFVKELMEDIEKKMKEGNFFKVIKRIRSFRKFNGHNVDNYSKFLNENSSQNFYDKRNPFPPEKLISNRKALEFLKKDKIGKELLKKFL